MPPIKNYHRNAHILMDGLLTTTKIYIMKKIFFIPFAAFAFAATATGDNRRGIDGVGRELIEDALFHVFVCFVLLF